MRISPPQLRIAVLALIASLGACIGPQHELPGSSFSLPKGDPVAGRAVFSELKCYSCHRVYGEDFPKPVAQPPSPIIFGLNEEGRTRTELAQSIIAPSHRFPEGRIGKDVRQGQHSRMGDFTESMTVRELIDLVAYLKLQQQEK